MFRVGTVSAGSASYAPAAQLGYVVCMPRREAPAFYEYHLDTHCRYRNQQQANGDYDYRDDIHPKCVFTVQIY